MILNGLTPGCYWYEVIDLDTGKMIERCIYADDETGEYRVLVEEAGKDKLEVRQGRIEIRDSRKK